MKERQIAVILPAYNEAESIGHVIAEVPKQQLERLGYSVQIVVVDNNSRDNTAEVARDNGAEVIFESQRGKGIAVKTALEACNADFIFMLDADYTYPATYIPEMMSHLEDGHPVVIGSRLKGKLQPGAMKRVNVIGNHILTILAVTLYQCRTTDLCTGFWGFRAEVAKSLDIKANGFDLEADMFSQIARQRLAIGQVPIDYRPRSGSSKLGSIKDGLRIARKLIRYRFRRTTKRNTVYKTDNIAHELNPLIGMDTESTTLES